MSKQDNFQSKTDELINRLLNDEVTQPQRVFHPMRNIIPWIALIVLYLGINIFYHGVRHDLNDQMMKTDFIFDMGLALSIFFSGAIASSWLSLPDEGQKGWIKTIPTTLFAVLLFWIITRSIEEGTNPFKHLNIGHCATDGIIMNIIPIAFLIYITMRGFTTKPYWSMAVNVIAVTALGWVGLKLVCSMDVMDHVIINHFLPFAFFAAILALFTRRLFKW